MYSNKKTSALARDFEFLLAAHPRIILLAVGFLLILGLLVLCGVIPLGAVLTFRATGAVFWAMIIQATIFGIAAIALVNAVLFVTKLTIETDFAYVVSESCEEEIRSAVHGSQREPMKLIDVPKQWPSTVEDGLVSLRLCKAIHADAYDRQFGSKEVMLQYYRDESNESLDTISNLQRVALHLGILGTFFGLVFAMPQLVTITDGEFEMAVFSSLFASLEVCFSTSILGLAASIFIGGLVSYCLHQQRRFFESLENAASALSMVVRHAHNVNELAPTLSQLKDQLADLSRRVSSQSDRTAIQNDIIDQGLASLSKSKGDLETFLRGVDKLTNHVSAKVDEVAGKISSAAYLDRIDRVVNDTLVTVSANVCESVDAALQSLVAASGALDQSKHALESSSVAMSKSVGKYDEDAKVIRKMLGETADGLVDSVGNSFSVLSEAVGADAKAIRSDRDALKQLLVDHALALTKTSSEISSLANRINLQDQVAHDHHEVLVAKSESIVDAVELGFQNDVLKKDLLSTLQAGFRDLRADQSEAFRAGPLAEAVEELRKISLILGRASKGMSDFTSHQQMVGNGQRRSNWWRPVWLTRGKPK